MISIIILFITTAIIVTASFIASYVFKNNKKGIIFTKKFKTETEEVIYNKIIGKWLNEK